MSLREYRTKRRFDRTPEPKGGRPRGKGRLYLIHEHAARQLHYDLRLELDGALKSWAVPKGPSLDPGEKRLAVHVEDHPVEYAKFEGTIPKGEYGAGNVIIWDRGRWIAEGDPARQYREGKLQFVLEGEKLRGGFDLVRMGGAAGEDGKNWLLIKRKDAEARKGSRDRVVREQPQSVRSGRTVAELSRRTVSVRASRPAARRAAAGRRMEPDVEPPEGARKAGLPRTITLQLATAVTRPPDGDDWIHEIKFDGYRAFCRIHDGKAAFFTRTGKDWTGRFGNLAAAAGRLPVRQAILDGEVVKMNPDGTTSFQELQNSLAEHRGSGLVYFAFDLLHLDGYDLTPLPLAVRKQTLAGLLQPGASSSVIRYSDHQAGKGQAIYEQACRHQLEGIISKRKDEPYRPGRGRDWLKVKCLQRQEFVIGGFTRPAGTRSGFGALLLGVHAKGGKLVYCGRVGTGFTERSLVELRSRLDRIEQKSSPFSTQPARREGTGVHWVKPVLAAEVAFTQWTNDGLLRQPSFQGLREDKDVRGIVRERPIPTVSVKREPAAERRPRAAAAVLREAGVRVTHPDKVLYPDSGFTKADLVRYYVSMADRVLPHLIGRPLMLMRCPDGYTGQCFYQKHATTTVPDAIRRVSIKEGKGRGASLVIDSLKGLISLVQMGVLEIHTWGATAADIDHPDRMIFDLDPDVSVPWHATVKAAHTVRARLADLDLESFVKTTGGKGLHVVVPLKGRNDWSEVRQFSHSLALALVKESPGSFTAKMSKAARPGKIFIDYLRNARGATAVAAFSTRARKGAPVSTPVSWEDLGRKDLRSDMFTISNLPAHMGRQRKDPWKDYEASRATITASLMRKL